MIVRILNQLFRLLGLLLCVSTFFAQETVEHSIATRSADFEDDHAHTLPIISQLDAKIDDATIRLAEIQTSLSDARKHIQKAKNTVFAGAVAHALGSTGDLVDTDGGNAALKRLSELAPVDIMQKLGEKTALLAKIKELTAEIGDAKKKLGAISTERRGELESLRDNLLKRLKALSADPLVHQLASQERGSLRDAPAWYQSMPIFGLEGIHGRPQTYRFLLANCRVLGRLLYGVARARVNAALFDRAEICKELNLSTELLERR